MTTHHPEGPNKIDNLPAHDNVATPDEAFQWNEQEKMSNQKLQEKGDKAKQNKLGHLGRVGVVGVVGLGLAVAGYFATKGGDKDPNEAKQDTTNSAPVKTGETTTPVASLSPESLIGKAESSSLDTLNVQPDQGAIDEALKGVPVSEYPDPKDAFNQLAKIYNVYELSATVNYEGVSDQETPESEQLGNQLLSEVLSKANLAKGNLQDENDERKAVAYELDFINNPTSGTPEIPATFGRSFTINTLAEQESESYNVTATVKVYTNFDEVDRYWDENPILTNLDEARSGRLFAITMAQEDGSWVWETSDLVE